MLWFSERFERIVDYKTYIPELGVWVSTVAYNTLIGPDRCAETMVFKGDENGITDWSELYFESHGCITDPEELKKRHDRIVKLIKEGKIKLELE